LSGLDEVFLRGLPYFVFFGFTVAAVDRQFDILWIEEGFDLPRFGNAVGLFPRALFGETTVNQATEQIAIFPMIKLKGVHGALEGEDDGVSFKLNGERCEFLFGSFEFIEAQIDRRPILVVLYFKIWKRFANGGISRVEVCFGRSQIELVPSAHGELICAINFWIITFALARKIIGGAWAISM